MPTIQVTVLVAPACNSVLQRGCTKSTALLAAGSTTRHRASGCCEDKFTVSRIIYDFLPLSITHQDEKRVLNVGPREVRSLEVPTESVMLSSTVAFISCMYLCTIDACRRAATQSTNAAHLLHHPGHGAKSLCIIFPHEFSTTERGRINSRTAL